MLNGIILHNRIKMTVISPSFIPKEVSAEEAELLNNAAGKLLQSAMYDEATSAAKEALLLANNAGSYLQMGRALNILGSISLDLGDYQEALSSFYRSLEHFTSLKDKGRIAIVTGNIGLVHRSLSDYRQAIEYYQTALSIDEELDNILGVARHVGNIGNVYLILGEYPSALEYYQKALSIDEHLNDMAEVANHLGNIGHVYLYMADYRNALEYYTKALTIHQQLGDKVGIAIHTGNIAGGYFNQKNYQSSLEYYTKALALYEELGNKSGVADVIGNIGLVYQKIEDYPNSLKYYSKAIALNEKLGNKNGLAFNTFNLGSLFGETKFEGYDSLKSIHYLHQTIALNEELGKKEELYHNHEVLAEVYNQIGEGAKAYHHHKLFHDLENEVQSEEAKKRAEQFDYERKTAERDKQIAVERAKHEATEQLLHNVLPPSIAAQMLDGTKLIAEKLDNVTVLFADIVGFTRLSQHVSPEELVQGLDLIFSDFDTLAEKYGLEKIKTIGDAYMVVSGAPIPRADHALVMASMAFELLETIRTFTAIRTESPIEIRVGIHSGEVVAGVIGKKKFAYDLWGDAVNTASRMESHSLPGKIHVTEEFRRAFEASNPNFPARFTLRGPVDIKGKGIMNTYFLES